MCCRTVEYLSKSFACDSRNPLKFLRLSKSCRNGLPDFSCRPSGVGSGAAQYQRPCMALVHFVLVASSTSMYFGRSRNGSLSVSLSRVAVLRSVRITRLYPSSTFPASSYFSTRSTVMAHDRDELLSGSTLPHAGERLPLLVNVTMLQSCPSSLKPHRRASAHVSGPHILGSGS